MRLYHLLLCGVVLASAACHADRPIVDPSPKLSVGGTIAGIVTTANPAVAVPGRKVTATEINKGSHYESTTAANGGYTIKVPEGTYRLEIELRPSETLTTKPDQTRVNNGDTDSSRNFVITVK
jgi:hypothetical protein